MRRNPIPPTPDSGVRARILDDVRAESRSGRTSLFLAILAVATFVLVAALSAYQATEERRAAALLESGVATLTDVDALLAERLPDVRTAAVDPEARDLIIPAFPIPITLTREEVLENDDAAIRALLLQRAAAAVYVDGLEAFDTTGNQSLGLASAEGLLNRLLGQLSARNHDRAGAVAFLALVIATAAAILAIASSRTYGTLRGVAIAVAAGALPGLVLAAIAVYSLGRVGGSDPFAAEVTALLQALFEVPRRNYLIVTIAAAFLAVCAYAVEFARNRYMAPAAEADFYPEPAHDSAPLAGDEDDPLQDLHATTSAPAPAEEEAAG